NTPRTLYFDATHFRGVTKDDELKGPNVVTGAFLLNNRYAFVLFDSGFDRSFVDNRFSSMTDIDPVIIRASYEVELADGRVASTNIVLKGCTLNLVNHVFEIDLMLIELGTFDVIIGMDWLVKHDAIIICGERVVRIPKYVERGCHLFFAHVTEDKSKEKRMEDVPVVHDFPEVFPEELPGLPPLRQDEEEHEKHLKIIFELLKKERLYAKFLKCDFLLDSVQFMGHVIDRSGVHVDPAKVRAIMSWATSTTPMEVRKIRNTSEEKKKKKLSRH
nr:reverse transcriptase domain-containing protein [Tanacetum cinerariifolium]